METSCFLNRIQKAQSIKEKWTNWTHSGLRTSTSAFLMGCTLFCLVSVMVSGLPSSFATLTLSTLLCPAFCPPLTLRCDSSSCLPWVHMLLDFRLSPFPLPPALPRLHAPALTIPSHLCLPLSVLWVRFFFHEVYF